MTSIDWLLGAPQFWLGVVSCASFILVISLVAFHSPKRVVEMYRLHDCAPLPPRDPFHRTRSTSRPRGLPLEARRDEKDDLFHTARLTVSEIDAEAREVRAVENRIKEARKRAMWHPHPDDDLPAWKLAW